MVGPCPPSLTSWWWHRLQRAWETPLPQWGTAAVRSARVVLLDPQDSIEEVGNIINAVISISRREQELQRFSTWTEASGKAQQSIWSQSETMGMGCSSWVRK